MKRGGSKREEEATEGRRESEVVEKGKRKRDEKGRRRSGKVRGAASCDL